MTLWRYMKVFTKYHAVFIALACCVAVCMGLTCWLEKSPADYLYVTVCSSDREEEIAAWKSKDDGYYFFLPAHADLKTTVLAAETEKQLSVDGCVLESNAVCSEYEMGVPYTLTYTMWGIKHNTTLTFVQSSNLPAMYIDTQSGNMDYIHTSQKNSEKGSMRIYMSDGCLDYSGNIKSIAGRGNSTWNEYEKKPYKFKLEEDGDLLAMGTASNWILLANATDASHMKNKIVFDFSSKTAMQYSPDSQWVDLYLNGHYSGLYLLCEKIETHPERLNIISDKTFLVSQEVQERLEESNDSYITTKQGQALRIRESTVSDEQIRRVWQNAENAIVSVDGRDPNTGKLWTDLIDLDSWARKYLIEEFFGNTDAGYCSQYFYTRGESGVIYAGPVWDYDFSMYYPTAFYANRLQVKAGVETPWYPALWQKPIFQSYVKKLYMEELKPIIKAINSNDIDAYFRLINNSAKMDAIRWAKSYEGFEEAVDHIRSYLSARIQFLDSVWINLDDYFHIEIDTRAGNNIEIHTQRSGKTLEPILSEIIAETENYPQWYDTETNQPVDLSAPVQRDMSIYAVWESGAVKKYLPLVLPVFFFVGMFLVMLYIEIRHLKIWIQNGGKFWER